MPLCELRESAQHVVKEERQPDAFALAVHTDPIHAVAPVARAHQRQAVHTEAQAVFDRAHAVLIHVYDF